MRRAAPKLDETTVRRATEAWVEAAKRVRARPGRGSAFEGESASDIIEAVASWRGDRALYLAYEREVRRRAYRVIGRAKAGRRSTVSEHERAEITRLAKEGMGAGAIAKRLGRTPRTIYRIWRGAA